MDVAAIMPCRGRAEQTVENVQRLLAAAGYGDWTLICVSDADEVVATALNGLPAPTGWLEVVKMRSQSGYWHCLQTGSERYFAGDATHLINLANDLWACDDWLKIAVEEYRALFGNGPGLLGFAGDGHPPQHSCHFLISRDLLARYGGWPTHYQHNFGDTELCLRAQADGLYAKSERAWLEHCHPMLGQGQDDEVYQAGRATFQRDRALFEERRRQGWPKAG